MDRNEVIEKVFPHSLFGYDPVAVDAFLDEVIREFDRLNNTIDVLQFRLAHELGDALQQNDRLSVELEYAEFGRRVNQLIAPPEEGGEAPAEEEQEAPAEEGQASPAEEELNCDQPAQEDTAPDEQPQAEEAYADGAREE